MGNTNTRRSHEAWTSFGYELRRRREEKGLSLRELAGQVNYSFGYLSKLERGTSTPTPEVASILDAKLGGGQELVELALEHARGRSLRLAQPNQLPPGVADFVGRNAELRRLDSALADCAPGSLRVIIVDGAPGVGKTALVLRWAHTVVDAFPDGQLFVNLHGWDRDRLRWDPHVVLEEILHALGVPSAVIPTAPASRAARFRSLLTGRRVLIVLDNAAGADQVLPLLPSAPGCMVVVTSRDRLVGVARRTGAMRVTLPPLSTEESVDLLAAIAGRNRVSEARRATELLASRCGYLPLALRAAGERAVGHPHHSMTSLAEELAAERDRLDVLSGHDDGEPGVRDVFSWSYRNLPDELARVFRLLGVHHRGDIGVSSVAALANCSLATARHWLERLANVHLMAEIAPDRYRCDDLLRIYAAECARKDDQSDVDDAVRRWLDWFAHSAAAANAALAPQRALPRWDSPASAVQPLVVVPQNYHAAVQWCAQEAPHLVAAVAQARSYGLFDTAWKLAATWGPYLDLSKQWNTWITAHTKALEAARGSGDRLGEGWCLHELGSALGQLRRYDDALECLVEAVRIRGEIGDQPGLAWSRCRVGATFLDMGRYADAREEFTQAQGIFEDLGDGYGTARALVGLGTAYQRLGRGDEALHRLAEAHRMFGELGARDGQACAAVRWGETYRGLGQRERALDLIDRGLWIRRELGDRAGVGDALLARGHVAHDGGDVSGARIAWQEALQEFDALNDPRAADARARLATLEDTSPARA